MGRREVFLTIALILAVATAAHAQIRAETIVRGLQSPVAVVADPTDPSVFLVVEQGGVVRTVRSGIVLAEPLLDLRNVISTGGERGLLGIAVGPDFDESRRLFVNFTDTDGNTVIARFERRDNAVLRADDRSRLDLMWPDGRRSIRQPFSNHNGGHLAFGRDGYLYVGLGDGGSGGDPMNYAQNPQSLLGKMLRLDVDVADTDGRGYQVPDDNPFVDGVPVRALPEIWAFGLRNPWRYTFDDWTRGGTGALTIGDVGQNAREEINFEPAGRGGRNYGWRLREGLQAYDARTPPAFGPLTEPIHDYGRTMGASITGGLVYRGDALDPMFGGRYFFADFVSGRVFSIGLHVDAESSEATADEQQEHTTALGGRSVIGAASSFGVDHDGEMLLLNHAAGTIVRIVPDFALVPRAPQLTARTSASRAELSWNPAAGVPAASYFVERLRAGVVVERLFVERPSATLDWTAGDCLRVRAQARTGSSGPPSSAICFP